MSSTTVSITRVLDKEGEGVLSKAKGCRIKSAILAPKDGIDAPFGKFALLFEGFCVEVSCLTEDIELSPGEVESVAVLRVREIAAGDFRPYVSTNLTAVHDLPDLGKVMRVSVLSEHVEIPDETDYAHDVAIAFHCERGTLLIERTVWFSELMQVSVQEGGDLRLRDRSDDWSTENHSEHVSYAWRDL